MNELSTGFARYPHRDLVMTAYGIAAALGAAPGSGYYPNPQPTRAQLSAAADALDAALAEEDRKSVTAKRHALRKPLILLLKKLAADLEKTAEGNPAMLAATGYGLRKTPVRGTAPPEAPTRLKLRMGPLGGTVTASCAAPAHTRSLELQVSPSPVAAPWAGAGVFTSSRNMQVKGLQRGTEISARVRAISANGAGPWSDPVSSLVG